MSFKDTLNNLRDTIRESNRQNLAHAYLKNEEYIRDLEEQIVKRKALLEEIEKNGDESTWIDEASASKISELYNRAHKDWLK